MFNTIEANVDGVSHDSGRLTSRRRIGNERHAVTAVAALVWLCGAAAVTHISPALCATQPQTVAIEDPRPIAKAVELLQSKYGYVVTYEDPRYTYEGDLKDISQQMTGSGEPRDRRIRTLVPVGGAVTISVPSTVIDSRTLAPVLSQLLQSHSALQRGGHFRLLEEGGVFHVIPTEVQDRSGNWQRQSSLLDSTITVPKITNANGMTMLNAICESLTKGSGLRVLVGTVPVNMLMQHRGDLEANGEVSRAVLLRALSFSSPQLSWSLLYDAGLQIFVLNVSLIESRS